MPLLQTEEFALCQCLALNLAALWGAWRLASKANARRSQAVADTLLLWFVTQYLSIGVPGLLGILSAATAGAAGLVLAAAMFGISFVVARPEMPLPVKSASPAERWIRGAAWWIALALLGAHCYVQRVMPITADDALTYHAPAAAQWLSSGSIGLLPTWLFNPANTYSPLAGSCFIAWWMAPFSGDVLARYVEVPALVACGAAIYAILRARRVNSAVAALLAAAVISNRAFFLQSVMCKDDLYVVFFFLVAFGAAANVRERGATVRLGIALGLLLATKYTALLALPPILLLWRPKHWRATAAGIGIAAVLAGPWYLRNVVLTGNPLYPMQLGIGGLTIFKGLFTTARSGELANLSQLAALLFAREYSWPAFAAAPVLAGCGWLAWRLRTRVLRLPLLRALLLGPVIVIAVFALASPFPEIRFLLPTIALLYLACGVGLKPAPRLALPIAVIALVASVATLVEARLDASDVNNFVLPAAVLAVVGTGITALWPCVPARKWIVSGTAFVLAGYAYVNWAAYLQTYGIDTDVVWTSPDYHGELARVWQIARGRSIVPAGSTIAYSNTYFTYPLLGFDESCRCVYVSPVRGVRQMSDLPWLGEKLSGEQLVSRAVAAETSPADKQWWLERLRESGANFLLIARTGPTDHPAEARFAAEEPNVFLPIGGSSDARFYRIRWR